VNEDVARGAVSVMKATLQAGPLHVVIFYNLCCAAATWVGQPADQQKNLGCGAFLASYKSLGSPS
jgi:hypothetical protein